MQRRYTERILLKPNEMIRKIQHKKRIIVRKYDQKGFKDSFDYESHLITTYWFLFIPVFQSKELIETTI